VDVFCPGFVADCIETLEEIAMQGKEAFLLAGGRQLRYIDALNDSAAWVEGLANLAERHMQGWITRPAARQPADAAHAAVLLQRKNDQVPATDQ